MLNPALLWLIAGVILCVMEFTLPTAFVEFTMGISAIVIALLLLAMPQLSFGVQVVLWLILSVGLTLVSRRFVSRKLPPTMENEVEAQTLTEIPAGEMGRVLYEGNSWAARCGDEAMAIAPSRRVLVVGRKGNTLIVMPQDVLQSQELL